MTDSSKKSSKEEQKVFLGKLPDSMRQRLLEHIEEYYESKRRKEDKKSDD
jgi:hypothetical protein